MGSYDGIYNTIVDYRNGFANLINMLEQMVLEKSSHADLVAWYRRRNFIIRTQATPAYNLAQANLRALRQQLDTQEGSDAGMSEEQYHAEVQVLRAKRDKARKELDAEYKPAIDEAQKLIEFNQQRVNDIRLVEEAYEDRDKELFSNRWKTYCGQYDRYIGVSDGYEGFMKVANYNELMADKTEAQNLATRWTEKLEEYQGYYSKSKEEISADYAYKHASLTKKYKSQEQSGNMKTNREIESNIQQWKEAVNELQSIASTVAGLTNTADLKEQANSINASISKLNGVLDSLDADVERVMPVPADTSTDRVSQIADEMKATISGIRELYPQKKFDDAMRVLEKIDHDINGDRGVKAFSNRSSELKEAANTGIKWENDNKWQITGQRWERKSGDRHGYTSVKATHSPIPLI